MLPWDHRSQIRNGISIGSAVVAQLTAESRSTDRAFSPLKLPLLMGIWTSSKWWFPGPTRVLNSNGISIGCAVFAGLTNVTDRQTDRPTDTLLGL